MSTNDNEPVSATEALSKEVAPTGVAPSEVAPTEVAPTEVAGEQPTSQLKETDKERVAPIGSKLEKEIGGPKGPEPTRYGDWEAKGRCFDF